MPICLSGIVGWINSILAINILVSVYWVKRNNWMPSRESSWKTLIPFLMFHPQTFRLACASLVMRYNVPLRLSMFQIWLVQRDRLFCIAFKILMLNESTFVFSIFKTCNCCYKARLITLPFLKNILYSKRLRFKEKCVGLVKALMFDWFKAIILCWFRRREVVILIRFHFYLLDPFCAW